MPRTLEEGFRVFHLKLTPTNGESLFAKLHRNSIEKRLKQDFAINRFFRIGSFGHGTSIANFSDVDYFASIPNKNLWKDSDYSLRQVSNSLADRFTNTSVGVRCPAVLVPFGKRAKESTEIVPAFYTGKKFKLYNIYGIPNCNGGWMRACPEGHNNFVNKLNLKLKRKLKPMIRFIKAWKYSMNVPISSFYLELRITKYLLNEKYINYTVDIHNFLEWLYDNNLPGIRDPLEISGVIHPCATQTMLSETQSKLQTALTRATKARHAEINGRIKDAFERWDLLFGNNFPKYYR